MNSFKGLNGTIILDDSGIEITRESMLETTFHKDGGVVIPYCKIKKVEVVPGSVLNGYIYIDDGEHDSPKNVFEALKNDNAVVFRFIKNGKAEKIRKMIEART